MYYHLGFCFSRTFIDCCCFLVFISPFCKLVSSTPFMILKLKQPISICSVSIYTFNWTMSKITEHLNLSIDFITLFIHLNILIILILKSFSDCPTMLSMRFLAFESIDLLMVCFPLLFKHFNWIFLFNINSTGIKIKVKKLQSKVLFRTNLKNKIVYSLHWKSSTCESTVHDLGCGGSNILPHTPVQDYFCHISTGLIGFWPILLFASWHRFLYLVNKCESEFHNFWKGWIFFFSSWPRVCGLHLCYISRPICRIVFSSSVTLVLFSWMGQLLWFLYLWIQFGFKVLASCTRSAVLTLILTYSRKPIFACICGSKTLCT